MGKLSDDESSSDSSNEFLVPADKLDLSSSFFQEQPKKQPQKKTPNPKAKQRSAQKPSAVQRLESSSSDDEYDYVNDESQVSSAELLSQVLKNLENAKKQFLPNAGKSEPAASTSAASSAQPAKDDLSQEISNLLMLGESQASTAKLDMEVDVKQEDAKEDVKADYAIPEKGVQIHLPGESLMMDKKKKKQQDLQKMLQNKINQRIRKTQMFTHKVGLLCWLSYGFHLNRLANDADLLGITLSLVSPQNYPKGRPDLKYVEKFTQWFGGLFKMCDAHKEVVFSKDLLRQRISDKKIYNYVELILLYVATVRGMGINCRLVVSLQPPRLKPKQDQLFKIPAIKEDKVKKVKEEDDDDEDDEDMEDVTEESTKKSPKKIKKEVEEIDEKSPKKKATKKPLAKSSKTTKSRQKLKSKEKSVSPTKIIPENSREAAIAASEEAKKKAAAILKGKAASSLKNCTVVLEKNKCGHNIQKSSKTVKAESKNKNNGDDSDNEKEKSVSKNTSKKTRSQKKDSKETRKNETSDIDDEDEKINEKESLSCKNTRSRRNLLTKNSKKINNDVDEDSDDEENDKIVNRKEKKTNQSNRTRRNISNKTSGKAKDVRDDDDNDFNDKNNEKNMSIAKKLSLRVRQKVEAQKSSALRNKKNANDKLNVEKKSGRKRKHSPNKELSDFEEEVTSSSEFSPEEKEIGSSDSEFSSDYEYEQVKPKKRTSLVKVVEKKASTSTKKNLEKSVISKFSYKSKNPRKLISSDDESAETNKKGFNVWVEVYVESEESWISVNVLDQTIHSVSQLFKKASQPVLYVIAWNSAGTLKDVTRRYCPHWLTDTRKKRVDEKWWKETLSNWKEKCSSMSRAENEQLLQRELEQPLPKTVSECKGHPLYVLQRHLLKFEALYPPDVVPLGHLKTGEAIYSRHCVHTLYSRETWVKRARVVKPAQEAYKIVKSMPKYDKLSGQKIKDQPLELFGKWQTTPYEPPEAKDGKVPRNEYGNVDLFKMCMLPKKCVYIDLPALNRIARKLNIDCAPACVGFNFGCRGALPAFQGFVVCEEYEDTLREAWEEEQVIAQKRAKEKREKRIYGNWKKLIKGLLIREKLAAKYSFGEEEENAKEPSEDEEEEVSTKNQKPATKKAAAAAAATGTKTRGKRGRPKQDSGNPKKKLKK